MRLFAWLSLPPENIRKPYGFSGGREKMRWEQNELICSMDIGINIKRDSEYMKLGLVIKNMD